MKTKQRKVLHAVIESKEQQRRTFGDYRQFIRNQYDGFPGALMSVTGIVTGHAALGGRIFRPEAFDIRGCKRILDAGCGDGRYSQFLLRNADPDALLTGFDYSQKMLKRARRRLHSDRVTHIAADLTRLPYADASFDAIVCGWVLEHLPDPIVGLRELARVLQQGGKMLLLCTEDTFTGAVCSRVWHCRTYNRNELKNASAACGLNWKREHWFSKVHKLLRMGGIVVELRRGDRPLTSS